MEVWIPLYPLSTSLVTNCDFFYPRVIRFSTQKISPKSVDMFFCDIALGSQNSGKIHTDFDPWIFHPGPSTSFWVIPITGTHTHTHTYIYIDKSTRLHYLVNRVRDNEKKRSERRKHCALAVVIRTQKFSLCRRPPSSWRGMAKI